MPTTGYSQTPMLLKGALIYFGAPMLIPIPNIIFFQYNPETMTRTLKPWAPPEREVTVADDLSATCAALTSAQRRLAVAALRSARDVLAVASKSTPPMRSSIPSTIRSRS